MSGLMALPGSDTPLPSTLTMVVVSPATSRRYTLVGPPLLGSGVPGVRLVAVDWKATSEPSAFSDGKSLRPLLGALDGASARSTRWGVPGFSGSVMSINQIERSVPYTTYATMVPSALIAGLKCEPVVSR